MDLPEGYAMRSATPEDVGAVAAVLLADDHLHSGLSVFDEDFVRAQWTSAGFDPAADAWVVLGKDDEVVGSASLMPASESVLRSWGVVHPEHRGLGLGSALLDRLQARASERLGDVPDAKFHHSINDVDEGARSMLRSRGFAFVRSFRHMQVDLDGPRDPGEPPRGVAIRGIDGEADLASAHAVFVEAFHDEWGYHPDPFEEWRALEVEIPSFDPSLWLLATEGERVVGALNAIVWGERGWIGELGVRRAWRGRGIASAMLMRSFAIFAERGLPRVMLNVDFDNPTGAVALYEKVGMRVVVGYDVYEKPIG